MPTSSLEMDVELMRYNVFRVAAGKRPIDVGIGVSTGEVICGYIGSEKRMDYTAIGDGVNLASRLESATKQYGSRIIISEFTRDRIGSGFVTRELDRIRVKGKTQPVSIFEVLGRADAPIAASVARRLELHDRGMGLYRRGHWREALSTFGAAGESFPEDVVFRLYTTRCRHFVEQPPPDDWQGVWDLLEK